MGCRALRLLNFECSEIAANRTQYSDRLFFEKVALHLEKNFFKTLKLR